MIFSNFDVQALLSLKESVTHYLCNWIFCKIYSPLSKNEVWPNSAEGANRLWKSATLLCSLLQKNLKLATQLIWILKIKMNLYGNNFDRKISSISRARSVRKVNRIHLLILELFKFIFVMIFLDQYLETLRSFL